MATYNLPEGSASLTATLTAPTSADRENQHMTYGHAAGTIEWSIPENDSNNSSSGTVGTFESAKSTDSGYWWTYEIDQIQIDEWANGSSRNLETIYPASSSHSGTNTIFALFYNLLKAGQSNSGYVRVTMTYTAIQHKWHTYLSKQEDIYRDEPVPIADPSQTGGSTGGTIPVYDHTEYTYSLEDDGESEHDRTRITTSNTIIIYTRPGSFSFGCQSGQTIQTTAAGGLTAAKVSEWAVHAGKYRSWYLQSNQYSSVAGGATSGALITAAWYNGCVDKITAGGCSGNPTPSKVSGGPNGTIISAAIINALGTAVSKSD